MQVTRAVTIYRSPSEVYEFWHQFENFPRFMYHLESVQDLGDGRSHWIARAPAGRTVEWDAEIVEDIPNQLIAWRSVGDDDDINNAGTVRFKPAPGSRGTEVHVQLDYEPPGGKLGSTIAKLLGGEEPNQQLFDDLRRLKQVLEVGEVVRSSAAPKGIGQGVLTQEPAQPRDEDAVEARR